MKTNLTQIDQLKRLKKEREDNILFQKSCNNISHNLSYSESCRKIAGESLRQLKSELSVIENYIDFYEGS